MLNSDSVDGTFMGKLCPRDRPNAINVDGIMRCCKLEKECAEENLNEADLIQCCINYDQGDTSCDDSFCLDCK